MWQIHIVLNPGVRVKGLERLPNDGTSRLWTNAIYYSRKLVSRKILKLVKRYPGALFRSVAVAPSKREPRLEIVR